MAYKKPNGPGDIDRQTAAAAMPSPGCETCQDTCGEIGRCGADCKCPEGCQCCVSDEDKEESRCACKPSAQSVENACDSK